MEDGGRHDLLKSLIAGGLAGMAGKSVVAPLDRIKILMQTQNVKYRQLGIVESLGGLPALRSIFSYSVLIKI